MSTETVFVIDGDEVTALAGGPLSLADHGTRTTRRASYVEFNAVTNQWEVTDAWARGSAAVEPLPLFSHPDYDVALAWEVNHYNQQLAGRG